MPDGLDRNCRNPCNDTELSRICGQFEETIRVVVEPEFTRRTKHAIRLDTSQLRRLDRDLANAGSNRRQRSFQTHPRIRRTADDLQQLAATDVDTANLELVRVRMFLCGDDFSDKHTVQTLSQDLDVLNLKTTHRQPMRQFIPPNRDFNKFA